MVDYTEVVKRFKEKDYYHANGKEKCLSTPGSRMYVSTTTRS